MSCLQIYHNKEIFYLTHYYIFIKLIDDKFEKGYSGDKVVALRILLAFAQFLFKLSTIFVALLIFYKEESLFTQNRVLI